MGNELPQNDVLGGRWLDVGKRLFAGDEAKGLRPNVRQKPEGSSFDLGGVIHTETGHGSSAT